MLHVTQQNLPTTINAPLYVSLRSVFKHFKTSILALQDLRLQWTPLYCVKTFYVNNSKYSSSIP